MHLEHVIAVPLPICTIIFNRKGRTIGQDVMATAATQDRKCNFCQESAGYTCPRCNIAFCSASCYKSPNHSQCSEGFYKQMVEEEMRNGCVSEESRKNMIEILRRAEEGNLEEPEDEPLDSDDEDDAVDLSVRMADVNLDDTDSVWKNLTDSEKQEFRQLVNTGDFTHLLPPWVPWWRTEVPLVQEVNSEEDSEEVFPSLVEVPPLSQVMKGKPAPSIPVNILNVLTAYAWIVRLFNGDHHDNCMDAAEAVLTLSTVLSANANFDEAAIAVETPKMLAQNHLWLMESEEFAASVKDDVRIILQGPNSSISSSDASNNRTYYICAALSDIHHLLSTCKTSLSRKKRTGSGRKGPSLFTSAFAEANQHIELKITCLESVKAAHRKIEFLLSFMKEYGAALLALTPT